MAYKTVEQKRAYYKQYYEKNKKTVQANTTKYKKRNPDKVKQWHYKSVFGITYEEYKALGDKCAICGSKEKLCLDHCHSTNKVRGILCRACNLGIGHLMDSTGLLKNAIVYLEQTNELP